jgi:hypothetical protein
MDDVKIYVQNEIRCLLFEYLTNLENSTPMNANMMSIKEVTKEKKRKSLPSEKLKKVRSHCG